MLGDISGNNAENRRRELYTRTHIVDDSIGGAKTKTKTKTKKQRTMTTLLTQYHALESAQLLASSAFSAASDAGLELIKTVKKLNAKSREIAEEHRANEAWTTERLERLERLNSEFASLIAESSQRQTTLDTLDRANAEASRLVNAKSLEIATERLENLKYELCELEADRVQMEENAIGYSVELAEIDGEIQDVKELLQSTRWRVRTQS